MLRKTRSIFTMTVLIMLRDQSTMNTEYLNIEMYMKLFELSSRIVLLSMLVRVVCLLGLVKVALLKRRKKP